MTNTHSTYDNFWSQWYFALKVLLSQSIITQTTKYQATKQFTKTFITAFATVFAVIEGTQQYTTTLITILCAIVLEWYRLHWISFWLLSLWRTCKMPFNKSRWRCRYHWRPRCSWLCRHGWWSWDCWSCWRRNVLIWWRCCQTLFLWHFRDKINCPNSIFRFC